MSLNPNSSSDGGVFIGSWGNKPQICIPRRQLTQQINPRCLENFQYKSSRLYESINKKMKYLYNCEKRVNPLETVETSEVLTTFIIRKVSSAMACKI